ncbi:hypothetical protein TSAR_013842 [Trichomalopsis sarcophagae]|uniref:Uncharacterized protein n=1 Tax=Trichomalopsis sarcophagae TaxID=543379 RepID=A0A232EGR3_9HYME|nr:hypothetical protein TSAR_013842 [Trichomalopsis sarcophagae]
MNLKPDGLAHFSALTQRVSRPDFQALRELRAECDLLRLLLAKANRALILEPHQLPTPPPRPSQPQGASTSALKRICRCSPLLHLSQGRTPRSRHPTC